MIRVSLYVAVLFFSVSGVAADFYIDPAAGKAGNDGSAERPWASLQRVLSTGLVDAGEWPTLPHKAGQELVRRRKDAPIKGGDTIWLRSGDYGDLVIQDHYNAKPIMIAAAEGHTPRFRTIKMHSGSNWVLKGLHISPAFGDGEKPRAILHAHPHDWRGPLHDIVIESCTIMTVEDASGWSADDWDTRTCSGIDAGGREITIRNNHIKNIAHGISVSATDALVEYNVIENFAADGIRGLGDNGVYQYNLVKNSYDVNDNHDDGFQSWSVGPDGVGTGVVKGIVLRGNTIINYEDPDQPHRGTLQGIGCFDGMFEDWTIENNVVLVDHWHGITLLGARGCRIINNTVIDLNDEVPGPAWIHIDAHKNGAKSSRNVVRNNLTTGMNVDVAVAQSLDHNLVVEAPEEHFVDFGAQNVQLAPASAAIDAGSPALAPEEDIVGMERPQGAGMDIGAYERPVE